MDIQSVIRQQIKKLHIQPDKTELALGEIKFNNGDCQVLSQSAVKFELIVDLQDGGGQAGYSLHLEDDDVFPSHNGVRVEWDRNAYACLLQVENDLKFLDPKEPAEHKQYTREGMIKRVMEERRQKADKAR